MTPLNESDLGIHCLLQASVLPELPLGLSLNGISENHFILAVSDLFPSHTPPHWGSYPAITLPGQNARLSKLKGTEETTEPKAFSF